MSSIDQPIYPIIFEKSSELGLLTKGLPKGSPLSPLLGAIALIPLDNALSEMKGIRYMDDWLILAKNNHTLRCAIKKTHEVLNDLQLSLHPNKTYIGRISKGFNFEYALHK